MKRPIAFTLGVLAGFLLLGVIGYFVFYRGGGLTAAAIDAIEFARLDELRRAANRDLENQAQLDVGAGGALGAGEVAAEQVKKLAAMAQPFEELAKKAPGEPIGARNEAVLWMLPQMPGGVNRQGLSEADAKSLDERAAAALQKLLTAQPRDASGHLLSALFALRRMERFRASREAAKALREEAASAFRKALEVDPKNLEAAYQLGLLLDDNRNAPPSAEAVAALAKAYELRPGNFYVLMRRLNALVRTESPETAEACRKAKGQCECVRRRILRENDPESDLIVLLDRAATAADAKKWDEAADALQIFESWLTAIAADLGDLPEVTPHPLDYMVFDFSAGLREKFPAVQEISAALEVKFEVTPQAASEQTAAKAVRLVDFDLDGKLELAVVEPGKLSLLKREDDGKWAPLNSTEIAGASGMLWGDLDRDEDPQIQGDYKADFDVVVYGEKGLGVYANQLADGKRSLALSSTPRSEPVDCAVLVDFDHDGDLDIVAAHKDGFSLFSNLGNAQFEDVTAYSSLGGAAGRVRAMVAVDFDRDGDLDVIVTCLGREKAGYLDNTRHGQMRWRELPAGFEDLTKAEGLFIAELDGNASWDVVIQAEQSAVLLTEQTGEGELRLKERKVTPMLKHRIVALGDFDNDGFLDQLRNGPLGAFVFRGDGKGEFSGQTMIEGLSDSQNVLELTFDVDDIDGDGDLDAAFAGSKLGNALNQGGNKNRWLTVRPRGAEDNVSGKVNHFALGTLVEVQTGSRYQAAVSDRPSVHFGLGAAKNADQVRLVFTNGFPQSAPQAHLAGNQFILEEMALKGSCPYIYTDRGNGWEFYSDCLWGAPIGMQYAEGKLQPGRPWEYLKLPGELLKEQKNAYRLMFTEELWEATYVDHVSLVAVDHPESVEIFTNEKVGPPSVAEPRIFTVSKRLAALSAKDLKGRDLSKTLAAADGDNVQGWDRSFRQGLVERHGLELDLGPFEPNAHVVLYLTGWIMPTDTSLNVALAQHPDLEGPTPPSLSVFNAEGKLEEAIDMLGFPGGKTKTIAIDLSGKFMSNDHRVVISTTNQIYWDEAFFTLNEPEVEIRTTPLTLLSANMRYWGFSKKLPHCDRWPSIFDPKVVEKRPRWLPMGGGFTPFGDALALLTATDDRMAILGSGDGLELTFEAIPPPEPGWKRDFILHSVGWDKDADLNTFFGQTVGPMPVGPDGGYLGPAVVGKPGEEGNRIHPRARFWKQLTSEATK